MTLKRVAIIMPFNDVDVMHGGSKQGIKNRISYFDQFLMLTESIFENWHGKNFEYRIIALHSVPFNEEKTRILNQINVDVVKADYDEHALKIRPAAYLMDFDCDFRLVLDVDMIAIKEPDFDFGKDALASYGGNKYNRQQWKNVCEFLGSKMPNFPILKFGRGRYLNWRFMEHYLYQAGYLKNRIFPYFNNGAVLVRNELAKRLGAVWVEYRRSYSDYILETQGVKIDLEGQDVIGLAINQVTDNWSCLPQGCNYILQDIFYLGRKLIYKARPNVSLFHYINVPEKCSYYSTVESYYKRIRTKYYGDKQISL